MQTRQRHRSGGLGFADAEPGGGRSEPVWAHPHLARPRSLGRADNTSEFELVHQPAGLGEAHTKLALEHRGGAELTGDDQHYCLGIILLRAIRADSSAILCMTSSRGSAGCNLPQFSAARRCRDMQAGPSPSALSAPFGQQLGGHIFPNMLHA